MTKGRIVNQNRKIIITLLLMFLLIGMSGIVSWKISRTEEQACWEELHQSVTQIGDQLEGKMLGDQELLESIATIIAGMDSVESLEVQKIVNQFYSQTMISHIAILLPGDRVMLPFKTIQEVGGIMSFEEEAALGKHISGKSADIRYEERMILRNFVPIVKDGKTVAMLYGVVDLNRMANDFKCTLYDGHAVVYLIDGVTGDFLMDTWHETLGNSNDFKGRKPKEGYSFEQMQQDLLDGKEGCCVFLSQSIGEYLYYYYKPVSINKWQVAISVPESCAFARAQRMNGWLVGFMVAEGFLLAAYFVWLLNKTKKELLEKQRLAETDLLTGLLNRNSFEEKLTKYPDRCVENLTCIYVDANGLHEINNTKGHAAGDRLLRKIANAIQSCFGQEDVYRIGGDEFVVFVKDEEEDRIQSKIERIEKTLALQGYYVSIGMFRQNVSVDMNALIEKAEEEMYKKKKHYYDQMGIDRRKQENVTLQSRRGEYTYVN